MILANPIIKKKGVRKNKKKASGDRRQASGKIKRRRQGTGVRKTKIKSLIVLIIDEKGYFERELILAVDADMKIGLKEQIKELEKQKVAFMT